MPRKLGARSLRERGALDGRRLPHSRARAPPLAPQALRTHVMILPLTPEGKLDLDSLMCAPTARGHGSGQQPPAWSAQRSSTVGEKGMPLKEKPYEAVPPVTSLERS